MKGSVIIFGFFITGVACGRLGIVPEDIDYNNVSYYVLCALILCVGFSVGNDTSTLKKFRKLNPGLALLPVMSLLGTIAGSLLVALMFTEHSPSEWLAVGGGMGYYSISSVLISEYRGPELGTIALLSNIVREMITLLGAPLLVRIFGSLSPIATAGATAMDISLPIITRACGTRYIPVSIYSGLVTDFSVPFIVTLFCSL